MKHMKEKSRKDACLHNSMPTMAKGMPMKDMDKEMGIMNGTPRGKKK